MLRIEAGRICQGHRRRSGGTADGEAGEAARWPPEQFAGAPSFASLLNYLAFYESSSRSAGSAVDMRQLTASLLEAREGTGEVRACLLRAAFKPRLPGKLFWTGLSSQIVFEGLGDCYRHCEVHNCASGCALVQLPASLPPSLLPASLSLLRSLPALSPVLSHQA